MRHRIRLGAMVSLTLIVIMILLAVFIVIPALGSRAENKNSETGLLEDLDHEPQNADCSYDSDSRPTPTARPTGDFTGTQMAGGATDRWTQAENLAVELEQVLMDSEPDRFGGSWIQHEPEYKLVFAFTEGGEEILRQYEPGRRLLDTGCVELRTVTYSYQELAAAKETFDPIMFNLGLRPGYIGSSSLEVRNNRVVYTVVDPQVVENRLRDAGHVIPGEVVLHRPESLNYDHVEGGVDTFTSDDGRLIYFVRQPLSLAGTVLAGRLPVDAIPGHLVIENDCLCFQPDDGSASILILWPNQSSVEIANGQITIQTISVGDTTALHLDSVEAEQAEALPGMPIPNCHGPYAAFHGVASQ